MRKILSLLLVLSIVVTSTVWEEPNVFAQELQMEEMSQEAFIEESNEFVEVSEEGLIELELPDDLLEQISEE